jgi:hypothetical protein
MKKVTLIQRAISNSAGTFGVLKYQANAWFTCERPWLDNQNNVSCIPVGSYLCRWTLSPRLRKETYEVLNVPRRSGIRIHSANFPSQVVGCIALGEKFGTMQGKAGVFMSVSAIRNFNSLLNKEDFTLEVKQ